ncbi:MAG: terminase large subunit, partial [Prevotella sp.]|nr:terminase large subunit [Prevotella sp.]
YYWDENGVHKFLNFCESEVRFNNSFGRTPCRFSPVQVFQFANIFGLVKENGNRLIRDAYIFVPRKFGKTTSMASLAVYDLLYGDHNAEVYIGANSYDQAKKCFNEVRAIMLDHDPYQETFRINREIISYKYNERDSLIQCLTANAKTKDGLSASLVIMDEYAQARNTKGKNGADLKNVLTTSMGIRENPLTIVITTASDVTDGAFYAELEGVKAVLRGEQDNDNLFADLFMPDVEDKEDDPATWAKVQPHLGVTIKSDFYELEWQKAQLSAENLLAFRTKLLNVFAVNEAKSWFSLTKAQALIGKFDIDKESKGSEVAIAFDLSIRDDFSAVSYTCYKGQTKKFYCHTDYYFPEGALDGHPNQHLYREWAEEGHLKLCKGDRISFETIAGDILRRTRFLYVRRISYDAYKAQDLVNLLSQYDHSGSTMTPFKQTYGEFNKVVESFEVLAYSNIPRIEFNDNPINTYCLTNCTIDTDSLGNKKPIKIAPNKKIDGVITCLMNIGAITSLLRQ